MEDLANRPQCLECGSHFVIKNGKQWSKQTYLCKKCFRCFTPNAKHKFRPCYIKKNKPWFKSGLKRLVRKLKENSFANF